MKKKQLTPEQFQQLLIATANLPFIRQQRQPTTYLGDVLETVLNFQMQEPVVVKALQYFEHIPEALATVFPATTLQTCIVHLIRNSLDYASWKDRKELAAALKPIYTAVSAEAAAEAMDEFERSAWGQKFPTVVASWRRAWDRVIPFFAFPPAVRRVIYTTNAIESLHSRLRKIIKTRGHFPSDDAATKLLWLALRNITADWSRATKEWREAMNQFAILYEERFTLPAQAGR